MQVWPWKNEPDLLPNRSSGGDLQGIFEFVLEMTFRIIAEFVLEGFIRTIFGKGKGGYRVSAKRQARYDNAIKRAEVLRKRRIDRKNRKRK